MSNIEFRSTELPTGAKFVEAMTEEERERALMVDAILPKLRECAATGDAEGRFQAQSFETLKQSGLLGLVVPKEYGGLGGGLRDLCAATFAIASACPSTALCFFFHCSSSSRGLLALEALEAGLFSDEEAPTVRTFAEKVLTKMGKDNLWLGNFASESAKSSKCAINITTIATRTEGGWLLNGRKSFGCSTGVADEYLVTAALDGYKTADGLVTFFVKRDAPGVSARETWDAIGLRATATDGLILENVFIPDEDSLVIPGAFVKMMQMSKGSLVGNQVAGIAVYLGATQSVYDYVTKFLTTNTFRDTGQPIGSSPMHLELIGKMSVDLETAYLWMRRQLELESTTNAPLFQKDRVVMQWRLCKGETTEACFRVAQSALKACGTSNTANHGAIARGIRDLCMGLVQAFPAERGRLEVAKTIVHGGEQAQFGVSA